MTYTYNLDNMKALATDIANFRDTFQDFMKLLEQQTDLNFLNQVYNDIFKVYKALEDVYLDLYLASLHISGRIKTVEKSPAGGDRPLKEKGR